MSENSKIEWCDHTFNPWRGCSRVSDGGINCYAERMAKRFPLKMGEWGTGRRIIASEKYWQQPLRWNMQAEKEGCRYRVFCGSTMDVFEDRPEFDQPRRQLFELIGKTPFLCWLLLTKRPENMNKMLPPDKRGSPNSWGCGWANVWVGVSIENQETANERIPLLLQIPAAIRFLSCEPLLGPIDLSEHCKSVDWVIVGGESGPKARPMHPAWVQSIRDQCVAAGVPFFFKQWGTWMPGMPGAIGGGCDANYRVMYPDGRVEIDAVNPHMDVMHPQSKDGNGACIMSRVGKKASGRLLDRRTWDEMPA